MSVKKCKCHVVSVWCHLNSELTKIVCIKISKIIRCIGMAFPSLTHITLMREPSCLCAQVNRWIFGGVQCSFKYYWRMFLLYLIFVAASVQLNFSLLFRNYLIACSSIRMCARVILPHFIWNFPFRFPSSVIGKFRGGGGVGGNGSQSEWEVMCIIFNPIIVIKWKHNGFILFN